MKGEFHTDYASKISEITYLSSGLDCVKTDEILRDCLEKSEFHADYVSKISEITVGNNLCICRPVGMTPQSGPGVIVVVPITSI